MMSEVQAQQPEPEKKPQHEPHPEKPEAGRWSAVVTSIAYAVVVTVVVLSAKIFFEATPPGRWLEIGTFEFLEQRISNFSGDRLPVVVLDISAIPGGHSETDPTSRPALREIIDALVDARAAAVGIDIDFSPGAAGWISRAEDPSLFDHLLSVNFTTKTRVRLGVFRTRNLGPESWLGLPKYSSLAADLAGTRPEALNNMYRAHQWVASPERHSELPALGYALALDYLKGSAGAEQSAPPVSPVPPGWLRPLLIRQATRGEASPPEHASESAEHSESEDQLVNYSKLAQLQTERLRTLHGNSVADSAEDFAGKIVILGDATLRNGADVFIPPGGVLTPGVFFHASAAYTFAVEPLYEFTHLTRNLLDIVLGLPFFAIAIFKAKQAKHAGDESAEKRWQQIEKRTLWVSGIFVFFLGMVLMLGWRIMWLDFILVIAALIAHPYLSSKAEAFGHLLAQRRARQQARAAAS
jgi:CHASE2 domain-containing sensor protein